MRSKKLLGLAGAITFSALTVAATVAPVSAHEGTSTPHAGSTPVVSVGGTRSASAAIGSEYGATAYCSSYAHQINLTVYALPADGLYSQTIWYKFYFYNLARGRYTDDTDVMAFTSYVNGFGQGTFQATMHGHYQILAQIWWHTNGQWYSRYAWATVYQNAWHASGSDCWL